VTSDVMFVAPGKAFVVCDIRKVIYLQKHIKRH